METLFAQQNCTVVAYKAGGAMVAGAKRVATVLVGDDLLTIFVGDNVLDQSPVPMLALDTPALQRKIGASTFVQMNGHRWAIDFGLISQRGQTPGRGPFAKIKYSRARNREFAEVLRRVGATVLRG